MEQFAAVALAHFLALLIPGVDFFLIARTAMAHGRRAASGVCVGVATANGVFVAAAFSGVSLIAHPGAFAALQCAGGVFLIYVGISFWRARVTWEREGEEADVPRMPWGRHYLLGVMSGLLNPKNALFYVSVATALRGVAAGTLAGYGIWMVSVVLAWDLFVAVALGSAGALAARRGLRLGDDQDRRCLPGALRRRAPRRGRPGLAGAWLDRASGGVAPGRHSGQE